MGIPVFRNTVNRHTFFSLRNLLLICIPLIVTITVFWKFFIVVNVPFRLDYAEGFIYTNTISAVHGLSIYHNVESSPYIFGFYTPLFNYIGAFLFKIFGIHIVILRGMSFIFFLITGACVASIVKKATKDISIAIFAALLFYSAFIVFQWSSIGRPDLLGVCFVSLGIAVVYVGETKYRLRLFLAAILFSLAFFAKQSFVFAPLAFFIANLFTNKKNAWSFAAVYLSFTLLGIFLLHFFTDGEFTKQVFFIAGSVPYNKLYTAFRISAITGISALPLVYFAMKRVFQTPTNFFSIYFLCSLITFFMLLRDGGIQNYLLEFILALILLAVMGAPWKRIQSMPAKFLYPLLILAQFFFILWSYSAFPWETKKFISERRKVFDQEVSIIKNQSSVLVEDPFVAYATNSQVEIDPYTFGQVSDVGKILPVKLFTDLQNGKYNYIDDYGAFDRIAGIHSVIKENFSVVSELTYSKSVKPFDYSLYNRSTITQFGTLYKYDSKKAKGE